MRMRILLLAVLMFVFNCIQAQLPQIIPPSPDASSLGKFGEIPVGKYTGTASVSVPIYTIDFDGLKLPISINYHSGGIKVEELASWVGQGWSLNAGGMIAKTVVGLPDNMAGVGYLNNQYQDMEEVLSLSDEEKNEIAGKVNAGQLDLEPDNYFFSFMGYSGKLFIDKVAKTVYTIPKTNLKFNYPLGEIIDAAGFRYIFGDGETLTYESNHYGVRHGFANVTWILKKIISPAGNEITFSYQDYKNVYSLRGSQSTKYQMIGDLVNPCVPDYNTIKTDWGTTEVMGKRIREISWTGGKIVFNKTANNRQDIIGDYSLDNVEVYNSQNVLIQKHSFSYSFRNSTQNMNLFSSDFTSYVGGKRLFLDSVKQVAGNENIPPYSFEYYSPNGLPYYLSTAQDHWGYYNAEAGNPNLLPIVGMQDYPDRVFGYARRNVNTSTAKNGTLSKVTYPTGGNTQFFYESNEAMVSPCDYVYTLNPNNIYNYEPLISFSVNQNRRETIVNVPAALCSEGRKKFTYTVNFPQSINCNSGTRDCIGNLQVYISNSATSQGINLLNNPIVNGQTSGEIWLDAGATYILTLDGSGPSVTGVSATVKGYSNPVVYTEEGGQKYVKAKVGGIRIAKTVSVAEGNPALTTNYYYIDRNNVLDTALINQKTSGRLAAMYRYLFHENYTIITHENDQQQQKYCRYLNLASSSMAPVASDNGNIVGYKMVEEIKDGGQEKIKQVSEFTSTDRYPDNTLNVYPFIKIQSNDFLRGLPLKDYALNYNSNTRSYSILKQGENTYTVSNEGYKKINGVRYACTDHHILRMGAIEIKTCGDDVFKSYSKRSQWFYLSRSENKEFNKDDLSASLQSKTDFTYGNVAHQQVTKSQTTNSKGEVVMTEFKYPHDFQSTPPYDVMVQKNMIAAAIETKNTNVTLNKILSQQRSNFLQWTNGMIRPASAEKSILGLPLETEIKFIKYSETGNLLEFVAKDGIRNSFVWGYNQQYPVAKIIGKSYDDVIAQSGLDLLGIINNPPSESILRQELDKLRTVPGIFVTTYTYKPLVGMTSETNTNGRTTYYEYDIFNRLSLVRDHDKNILKKICYNYAGQPENCNSACGNTEADWQDTKNFRCELDEWGNNTGYQELEQVDMNSCSPTYKQSRWIRTLEQNWDLCSPAIPITATNGAEVSGYIAEYKNESTGLVYVFKIPPDAKMSIIGSLPQGVYTLTIRERENNGTGEYTFESGCVGMATASGLSGSFSDVKVSLEDCNSIRIDK